MRPTYFIIALLICTGQLFAQKLSNESLVGTWKVVNSQLLKDVDMGLDAEGMKKMEMLRKGFINAKFTFGGNAKFTIEFPTTVPDFLKELEFLNNKSWSIKENKVIQIGNDKENLMNIVVRGKENKIFFFLGDMPVILEVVKL